jgi:hypothetical protein
VDGAARGEGAWSCAGWIEERMLVRVIACERDRGGTAARFSSATWRVIT